MANWEPRWKLTVDCRGRNQAPPFRASKAIGDLLSRLAPLQKGWRLEFDSQDVVLDGLDVVTAAMCFEVPDHASRPFVKSAEIDDSCVPPESYFHASWREHRRGFWSSLSAAAKNNPRNVPPLLSYVFAADDPVLRSLLMAGDCALLLLQKCVNLHLYSTASPPLQSVCQGLSTQSARGATGKPLAEGPLSMFSSTLRVTRHITNGFGYPFLDWQEPRFALGREPYYDYWQLRPVEGKNSLGGFPEECISEALRRHWLEKATVRYSGGHEYRDFELLHLMAGALNCQPALTYWRLRFAGSESIRSSAAALAAMVRILMAHREIGVPAYRSLMPVLKSLGIPIDQLDIKNEKIHVRGHIDADALEALRLLIPLFQLITEFLLDWSNLDEEVLA